MKRTKINVFKLTHTYLTNEDIYDSKYENKNVLKMIRDYINGLNQN